LSSEAAGFPNQQHEIAQEHFPTDNLIPQNLAVHSEFTMNHNQQQLKYYSFSPTSYCVLDFFQIVLNWLSPMTGMQQKRECKLVTYFWQRLGIFITHLLIHG
jgi:hypothetical protein